MLVKDGMRHERLAGLLACLLRNRGRLDWVDLLSGVRVRDESSGRVEPLTSEQLQQTVEDALLLQLVDETNFGENRWFAVNWHRAEIWLKVDGGRGMNDVELDRRILAIIKDEGSHHGLVPSGTILTRLRMEESFAFVEMNQIVVRVEFLADRGYLEWKPARPLGSAQVASFHCRITALGDDFLNNRPPPHANVHVGDRFEIHTMSGGVLNLKSSLHNVQQTVNSAQSTAIDKAALNTLLESLYATLRDVPGDDSEAIATIAEETVGEALRSAPRQSLLSTRLRNLLEHAQKYAAVYAAAKPMVDLIQSVFTSV